MDLSNTISHMIYKLIISMRFPSGFHILDAANVVSIIYHPLYNVAVNLKRKIRGSSMKFKFCHHNIVITSCIYIYSYILMSVLLYDHYHTRSEITRSVPLYIIISACIVYYEPYTYIGLDIL
jgi:hypothetical protein